MGSRFDVSVVSDNQQESDGYIDIAENEILRIEKLISSWDSASQTSLININAGIKPVIVDVEFFNLIERAIKISNLREGAFDISYASMDRIWKFDGSMKVMPSDEAIKKSVSKVGYHNIVLNHKEHSVFLKLKGMKIGFGPWAKVMLQIIFLHTSKTYQQAIFIRQITICLSLMRISTVLALGIPIFLLNGTFGN